MAGRRTPMPPNLEQKGGATGWPDNVRDGSERAWSGTGRRNMRPTLPNLERKRGAIEWPDSVPNGCERGRRGEGGGGQDAHAAGRRRGHSPQLRRRLAHYPRPQRAAVLLRCVCACAVRRGTHAQEGGGKQCEDEKARECGAGGGGSAANWRVGGGGGATTGREASRQEGGRQRRGGKTGRVGRKKGSGRKRGGREKNRWGREQKTGRARARRDGGAGGG